MRHIVCAVITTFTSATTTSSATTTNTTASTTTTTIFQLWQHYNLASSFCSNVFQHFASSDNAIQRLSAFNFSFQVFPQCIAIHLTFQILQFNSFYISAFLAVLCDLHSAVNLFASIHLHFCVVHVYIVYSIYFFELCSNPFTWFKPFNVSLRLNLCGFIKTYFQPQFVLQHSLHFMQEMHFLVYINIYI